MTCRFEVNPLTHYVTLLGDNFQERKPFLKLHLNLLFINSTPKHGGVPYQPQIFSIHSLHKMHRGLFLQINIFNLNWAVKMLVQKKCVYFWFDRKFFCKTQLIITKSLDEDNKLWRKHHILFILNITLMIFIK